MEKRKNNYIVSPSSNKKPRNIARFFYCELFVKFDHSNRIILFGKGSINLSVKRRG